MRRAKWLGMLALLAGYSTAQGADLLDIYRLARENDPAFAAARHAYAAAQEKLPQAKAGLFPVLNLSGSDNKTRASSNFTDTPQVDRNVHAWSWSLQLTQPLVRMQNIYAYNESEWLVEQARSQFDQAEQDLILRVVQAYFEALVAQENIELADAQVKAAGEQLALAQRGYEVGANAITDVHEAKSRADLARAQRISSLNDLDARLADLEKIAGQIPERLAGLQVAAAVSRPQPDDAQPWMAQARVNNPAVRALLAALGAAEAAVSKSRSEYSPTLDMVASYGNNYSSGNAGTPSDFETRANSRQLGVQFNMPLYSGGASSSRVTEAMANRSKAASELEMARRQAGAEARQAYLAIDYGLAQIEALASAVESSKSAVNGNQAGYKLGIHMNIDVLNAEQQLYTAQRDLLKARYAALLQGFKLRAAAGELSEKDVLAANGLLSGAAEHAAQADPGQNIGVEQ